MEADIVLLATGAWTASAFPEIGLEKIIFASGFVLHLLFSSSNVLSASLLLASAGRALRQSDSRLTLRRPIVGVPLLYITTMDSISSRRTRTT